jgi:hypothetical protein
MTGRRPPKAADETGSVSAELVIFVVPVLVTLAMFVLFCGRTASAVIDVRAAAAAGARAATNTSTPADARRAAADTVAATTNGTRWSCDTAVDTTDLRPGGQVRVRVACLVRLSDLGLPVAGQRAVTAAATEPVDSYRSTP